MGIVTDVILPVALAFIMFSLGLGLVSRDFLRILRQPRDFVAGAISQMLLLPAVAFAIAAAWPMAPELAVGLIIIAAAPGGVTSNLLTSFARGDVALSISLTAVSTLAAALTVPLVVMAAHAAFIGGAAPAEASLLRTALGMFLMVTAPVLLGMLLRARAEVLALRFEPIARRVSAALFVLVLAGAILQERANIVAYFAQAGLVTLALNLAMMAIAFAIGAAFGSGLPQRIAITIECGLQNGTLAIAVATMMFGGGLTVVPAATYSLIMFATAFAFIAVIRRTVRA